MTEHSYLFDFRRVSDFFSQWNVKFRTMEMNGGANFEIVLASFSPSNIGDCLTNNGILDTSQVTGTKVANLGLKWEDETITIANDVIFNLGTEIMPLKAVFIRNKTSKYVMGYSINQNSVSITNQVIFDKGTILWGIHDGGIDG